MEIQSVHLKGNQSWVFIRRTDAEAETPILWPPHAELTHWKRLWCWEGLWGGEGDDRGWDGWMASPTQWAWVWVNSRSWWWTGRPGVLPFRGLQRVRHDRVTELNWPMIRSHRHSKMSVYLLLSSWWHCDKYLDNCLLSNKMGKLIILNKFPLCSRRLGTGHSGENKNCKNILDGKMLGITRLAHTLWECDRIYNYLLLLKHFPPCPISLTRPSLKGQFRRTWAAWQFL